MNAKYGVKMQIFNGNHAPGEVLTYSSQYLETEMQMVITAIR